MLGDTRLTYAQVNGAANQVANLLVSRGIQPGDKVALTCPNLPYFPIVYYGILKAGATVVPLNVLLKGREVAYHLDDSDAKAYFCFQGTAELPMARRGTPDSSRPTLRALLPDHRGPGGGVADRRHRDARPAHGRPAADVRDRRHRRGRHRGHPLHLRHHRSAQGRRAAAPQHARQRARQQALFGADKDQPDTYLCVLPLFHSFGQTVIQNGAFAFGGTVVMLPRFEAEAALGLMIKERSRSSPACPRCTGVCSVRSTTRVDVGELADNLRVAAAGGSALPVEVHKEFQRRFGVTILEGYGLSETSPVASFSPYGEAPRVGSIGVPIPGVEMKLMNDDWSDVPDDPTRSARSRSRATTS